MNFKRIVQTLSFIGFLVFLWLAAFPLTEFIPVNAFLKLDPVVFLGVGISARSFTPFMGTAVLILGLTAILGRFFCSTLCPMGVTIDIADWLVRKASRKQSKPLPWNLKSLKYQILLFILGAAFGGVSLVFLASPLSLVTRLFSLIIYPVLYLVGGSALTAVRPLANFLDITGIVYTHVSMLRFDLQWFTVSLFIGIFSLAVFSPRFWCRHLCPSAAVFALISRRPLIRRQVTKECNQCGRCQKKCPMGAINDDFFVTDHSECIVCMTCVSVCPEKAVGFPGQSINQDGHVGKISKDRRRFIQAGASGMGAAIITLTSLNHLHGDTGPGRTSNPAVIRPPGALPEKAFLARCIRCGVCMKACPTNTLQPMGLFAGFAAFFSPRVIPRRGPCKPTCNVCGQVCPTGAVRALPLAEKIWAKIGTAHILRHKCLAWEFGKKCLICDEFCSYNALDFKMVDDIPVAVPFVDESKCSGCGLCEHNCPVQARAAIVVEPMGSLRLATGSYPVRGREIGLDLNLRRGRGDRLVHYQEESTILDDTGLPPGFSK
jgi:MauM/NapG family ferredoxin protein